MRVVLKHDVERVKNGFAAYSRELNLAAHGYSAEVVRRNLEWTALCLLRPFEREGRLREELEQTGLLVEGDGEGLRVLVVD